MIGGRSTKIAFWGAVGALVASAHVAAAAWAMRQQIEMLPAAPPALEIDLAPAPPPIPDEPQVEEPEPESEMAEPVPDEIPVPDFVPPPVVPLPPPDFASLLPLQTTPPPKRPEKVRRVEPAQKVEKPKVEKPKSEKKTAARRERPRAETGRAEPQRSGAGSPRASAGAVNSWERTVGARVSAHMRRASASGARGQVSAVVTVTVQPNGAASGRLSQGTGNPRVDAALQRQASRMPRMPAPPNGQLVTFSQPIRIEMR